MSSNTRGHAEPRKAEVMVVLNEMVVALSDSLAGLGWWQGVFQCKFGREKLRMVHYLKL